jgi:hypothetical protein
MKGTSLHLAAFVAFAASCSVLLAALAGCGSNDGSSTAQSQRSTVRSATTVVACPDNVLCIVGDHWDTVLCRCVPNDDAGTAMDASADAAPADDGSTTPDGSGEAGDEGDAGSCPGH